MPTPALADPDPRAAERRTARLQRSVQEVWIFSAVMATGLSVLAFGMTGDLLLSIPVVAVCGAAALAGTVLAPHRSRDLEDSGRDPGFLG